MKPNDFEKQLQRQPMRALPPAWREEILQAAASTPPDVTPSRGAGWLARLQAQIDCILYPSPRALAGLAAVWAAILVLNFASRSEAKSTAFAQARPSGSLTAGLTFRERYEMLSHLFSMAYEPAEPADRPRSSPRPRSQCTTPQALA